MKKVLIGFLMSIVAVAALIGCTGTDPGSTGPTADEVAKVNQANAAKPAPPLTEEEKKILAGGIGGGNVMKKGTQGK